MEVSVVKHVVRPSQLVAGLVTHNNLVAVYLVLEKYELAAHASLQEGLRDAADSPRAVLPLASIHVVTKAHANSAGEWLRSKELVEGLSILCLAAHGARCSASPTLLPCYIGPCSLLFVLQRAGPLEGCELRLQIRQIRADTDPHESVRGACHSGPVCEKVDEEGR